MEARFVVGTGQEIPKRKGGKMTDKRDLGKDTYTVIVECSNCGFGDIYGRDIEVSKGTKVDEVKCPNCGCLTLKRGSKMTEQWVEGKER